MAKEISVELTKQYLLDRVGELKAQVHHGNPFLFLGAFSLINTISKAIGDYRVVRFVEQHMGLPKKVAELIDDQHYRLYQQFTLQPDNRDNDCEKASSSPQHYVVTYPNSPSSAYVFEKVESAKKLNLSHKDRDHLKFNPKNESVTLAAAALLEDLEKGINSIFDSLTDLEKAKLYVNVNDGNQFVGYGD